MQNPYHVEWGGQVYMVHMELDIDQKVVFALEICPFFCDVQKPQKSSEDPLLYLCIWAYYGVIMYGSSRPIHQSQ